jgi:hypothetical protein
MIIFLNDDAFEVDPIKLTEWIEANGSPISGNDALDRVISSDEPAMIIVEEDEEENPRPT